MDIEFAVQLLQLANAAEHPQLLVPGTLAAVEQLRQSQILQEEIANRMRVNYQCLRDIESGIRLMNLSARHELPSSPGELEQLSFLMQSEDSANPLSGQQLQVRCQEVRADCRTVFNEIFARWRPQERQEEE
jgi:glutamine synthetase adenylyltransferase